MGFTHQTHIGIAIDGATLVEHHILNGTGGGYKVEEAHATAGHVQCKAGDAVVLSVEMTLEGFLRTADTLKTLSLRHVHIGSEAHLQVCGVALYC